MSLEVDSEVFEGTVIFFSAKKGFGFLDWEKNGVKQTDLFIHFSDLVMEGYKTVKQGQKVQFKLGVNLRGQPKGIEITPIA